VTSAPVIPGESSAPTTATSAPVTLAPVPPGESSAPTTATSAPVTSGPVTLAPVLPGESSAPTTATSAPVTSGPVTSAPVIPGESSAPTTATPVAAPTAPTSPSPTSAGPVCDVTVTTVGIAFSPSTINIVTGETVCWTPTSFHNVQQVADSSTCDNMTSPSFVGNLGQVVQHTFTQPGTFFFKCDPHCSLGMRGTVVVTEASSTSSTTPAPTPLACPRNCGQPENGGGTCDQLSDGRIRCLSCNADKIRLKGRCNVQIDCRGNVIQSGRLTNQSCRCLDNDCYSCIRVSTGDTCRRCRNNKYLHEDACHNGCPSHLTHSGVGAFKRRCVFPHICQSDAIGSMVNGSFVRNETVGHGCRCPDQNCYRCDQRAGEFGHTCLRCRGSKFLYNATCLDDCSSAPSNHIEYIPAGSFGRECRPPFVCRNRLDENGVQCKCHRSVNINGRRCEHCEYNASGVTCLE